MADWYLTGKRVGQGVLWLVGVVYWVQVGRPHGTLAVEVTHVLTGVATVVG